MSTELSRRLQQVCIARCCLVRERQIFAVTDGEIDLDGVELRYGSEYRLRVDQVSHLDGGLTGNAGNERPHFAEAEIQSRGFNCRLRRVFTVASACACCWTSLSSWLRAIARASASGVSRFTLICAKRQLRLSLPDSCPSAWSSDRLKRTGIDLEQNLALA